MAIMGFIGKMGCFAKGTKVKTLYGEAAIEDVDTVLSYDFSGNIVSVPCGVLKTKKVPYQILFADGSRVVCSSEHPFLTRGGWLSTEDLKVGDRILYFQDGELQPIRKEKPYVEGRGPEENSKNVFGRLQPPTNKRTIQSLANTNNCEIEATRDKDTSLERTTKYRQSTPRMGEETHKERITRKRKPCVQAWQNDRSEEEQGRILVDSETGQEMGVLLVQSKEHEQTIRLSCSSQGLRQQEQLSRQFGCFVPVLSCTSTFLEKEIKEIRRVANEEIEMYDLIVPNTNNFILSNGVITHNSGKTLSMVRESLKYYVRGYRIMSNFHLNIPYEPIDFPSLYELAQNQENLSNVVLLLDEVHILMDSRGAVSKKNKVMTFWLNQTRKMGVKLFFTTQYLHQVDKRLRSGTDFVAMCNGIDVIKGGEKYFVCMNAISDGEDVAEDVFVGNPFFKYYDTNEVIGFMREEDSEEGT